MISSTYLFYDIESTGLSVAFDQILRFAAIRTDADFNEIEQHEISVKLRPDVIPSPQAMLSHRLSLADSAQGVGEYEALLRIHALLNEPNTISLGYNTLGFDDEFLRFGFHRNLLPPYTHQYAHNCGRMDLLPITTLYWLYKNDVLEWPEVDGRVSLKLENLNEANNLTEGPSHDALIDVMATIALAKRLAKEQAIWHYLSDYFKKGIDRQRLRKLQPLSDRLPDDYRFGLLVRVDYGSEKNYQVPVVFVGQSQAYSNQQIWLRLDRPELVETAVDDVAATTWVVRKKMGEPGVILPAYDRFLSRLDAERTEILQANRSWLEQNPDMLQAIAKFHQEYTYPEIPNIDVDAALYQMDFMSDQEMQWCSKFHKAAADQKTTLLDRFHRPAIIELAKRILFRNFPEVLHGDLVGELKSYMKKVNPVFDEEAMVDYRGRCRLTPRQAMAQITTLRDEGTLEEMEQTILGELENYLKQNFVIL